MDTRAIAEVRSEEAITGKRIRPQMIRGLTIIGAIKTVCSRMIAIRGRFERIRKMFAGERNKTGMRRSA